MAIAYLLFVQLNVSGCPSLALGIPEVGNLYCSFDSQCLGIQCCLTLRVADLIQLSYQAYARVDIDEMSLTVGFENWKHAWNLELREQGNLIYTHTGAYSLALVCESLNI